jgi:hypothetical protein
MGRGRPIEKTVGEETGRAVRKAVAEAAEVGTDEAMRKQMRKSRGEEIEVVRAKTIGPAIKEVKGDAMRMPVGQAIGNAVAETAGEAMDGQKPGLRFLNRPGSTKKRCFPSLAAGRRRPKRKSAMRKRRNSG